MTKGRTAARWMLIPALVLAFSLAGTVPWSLTAVAVAQEQGRSSGGGGLLRHLFGRSETPRVREAVPDVQPRPQQRAQQQRRTGQLRAQAAPATSPAAETVAKAEDARKVLVVGDFVAGGLGEGLEAAYAENPGVVIVTRSNGSSGLVRDDYYDWPASIAGVLEAEEPDIVIVMIGANDRQQMVVEGRREEPRSEAWKNEYESRIGAIVEAVRQHEAHLIWVGMVPFRFRSMSSDMIAFNDLYRRASEEAGGEYVDVWGGFVDEEGNFASHGPDMNGQPVQLRAGDGINITRAGKRKIAFYVEKPLNRLLSEATPPAIAGFGPLMSPEFDAEGGELRDIERTLPISLSEPAVPGQGELLGGRIGAGGGPPLADQQMDEALGSRPGRADDFMRRRPSGGSEADL